MLRVDLQMLDQYGLDLHRVDLTPRPGKLWTKSSLNIVDLLKLDLHELYILLPRPPLLSTTSYSPES